MKPWSAAATAHTLGALLALATAPALAGLPAANTPGVSKEVAGKAASMRMTRLPLSFEANRGQFGKRVHYMTRAGGRTLFLTDTEAVVVLPGKPLGSAQDRLKDRLDPKPMRDREPVKRGPGSVLRMRMVGAVKAPAVAGLEKLPGIVNYFIGNDPAKWHSNIPTYRQVRYAGIYPGTDLVFYGGGSRLEYDFILKPGADPKRIRLAFEGADRLRVAANGDLVASTRSGDVLLKRPYAYQVVEGKRVQVACDYRSEQGQVALRVARYDASRPLVVDPALVYSTYLGGSDYDYGQGIAVDTVGAAYVMGCTNSTNFPVTSGAFRTTQKGGSDAFVTKLNASGSALVYSTYLGGTDDDYGRAIALDAAGAAYVTGDTYSSNLPVTGGAFSTTFNSLSRIYADAFVTKLNAAGSALVYSTYLGGIGDDYGRAIDVDASGAAHVTGYTYSTDFPVTGGAFDTTYNGGSTDAFVTKLNAAGSALVYSTYVGGSSNETGYGIAMDAAGAAYVTGWTASTDFPVTSGAFRTSGGGSYYDAFVTKLNATGSALVYSTYLGGSSNDYGYGIAVDAGGAACITGDTNSTDFPVTGGAFDTTYNGGSTDAFVTELNAAGSALVYSTYLGGTDDDFGCGIAVDASGTAHVTGYTYSAGFPTTTGAFDTTGNSSSTSYADAFVTKLQTRPGSSLIVSDASVPLGATIPLRATLTSESGAALNGLPVEFQVDSVTPPGSPVTTNSYGVATLNYQVPEGIHAGVALPISAAFSGSDQFGSAAGTAKLTIVRCPTSMEVAAVSTIAGMTTQLSARIKRDSDSAPLSGKTISFLYNGLAAGSGTTDSTGYAVIDYTVPVDTPGGAIPVKATFAGDTDYLPQSASGTTDVTGASGLLVDDVTAAVGATVPIRATLKRMDTKAGIPGATVILTVDGVAVKGSPATTDANGVALLSYTIPSGAASGAHTIGATFDGSTLFAPAYGVGTLTVTRIATTLTVSAPACAAGGNVVLTGTLTRTSNSVALGGYTLDFAFNGISAGTGTTDANGRAQVTYSVPPATPSGDVPIGAQFTADDVYESSSAAGTARVTGRGTLAVTDVSGAWGKGVTLAAKLTDDATGGGIQGKSIALTIDGGTVAGSPVTTDANGNATLAYTIPDSLTIGTHTIGARFVGDATYQAANGSATLTVTKAATSIVVYAPTGVAAGAYLKVYAYLKRTTDNTILPGRTVQFTVNGLSAGSVVTDGNGYAETWYKTPSNTPAGTVPVVATFAGDDRYTSSTRSTTATIYAGTATSMSGNSPSGAIGTRVLLYAYLYQTLPASPKVMVAGKTLAFTVDGKKVGSGVTDANGYAAYNWQVPVGTSAGAHALVSTFLGDTVYGGATRTGTVTTSGLFGVSVSMGSRQGVRGLPVTLYCYLYKSLDGTMLGGRTVTFQVDGVDVGTGATDANGYATCIYTVPADAATGSHAIRAVYAGDATYAAGAGSSTLTVAAKDTLAWSMPSFTGKKGAKVTLYAYLKSATTGTLLGGKSVTFKVDGAVVGTSISVANGYVSVVYTVPAGAASGAHPVAGEFAGDATTNAGSKASTLTVQ